MTLIERVTDLDNFESERFLYRHATEEDAADMFEMFHNPDVLKWIHVPMPESIEHTLEISIKKFHLADPLASTSLLKKQLTK
ncbi:GNAT family N-acetyltransferase [Weissella confusa]|uniref:GNAT family N-acetyltransferase n=1 Tax=Weissella confusa TaxID=1583 RepID=UPI001FD877A6|nr:GNAT family N-acetyltransferase [Weissella confusa]